ncbi:hypothetical protein QUF61_18010, partial [Candidatus Venteria ishoeyi]
GVQGPQGDPGVDGAGMIWQGSWSAAVSYNIGDAVENSGSSYISLQDANQGNTPPATGLWGLVAVKGNTGSPGSSGSRGATGATGPAGSYTIGSGLVDSSGTLSVTFGSTELLDLSGIDASTTTEGLRLPQAADVSNATAEGQISWDTDNDTLFVGTGSSSQIAFGTGSGDMTKSVYDTDNNNKVDADKVDGVDGAPVGASSANTGAFTTLEASSTTTLNAGVIVKNGASAGTIEIFEASGGGTEKVTLQTQAMAADYSLTLPADGGSNGEILSTDGSGVLSWTTAGNVTLTGAETLTNKTLTNPTLTNPTINASTLNGAIAGTPTFLGAVVLNTPDINGGSVDGAPVGANSASTGAFTNLTTSGDTTLGDTAADIVTVTGIVQGASPLIFEGGTADGNETTLAITAPSADRTITLPDASGTVVLANADGQHTQTIDATAKTAAYTLTNTDGTVLADTFGSAFTFTLPTASGIAGRTYTVKLITAGNDLTLDGNAAETIDGVANSILSIAGDAVTLISDGTNWWTIANKSKSPDFKDEDTMTSDSDTAVASQQSIKAYVDSSAAAGSGGYPTSVSAKSSSTMNHKAAVNYCSNLTATYTDWRLPTAGELANLCASGNGDCTGTDYLWTATHRDLYYGGWVVLRPSDDYWFGGGYDSSYYVRCVR